MATHTAPAGLDRAGKKLWTEIARGQYELRPDEVRVLVEACREADLIERIESALSTADLLVPGPRPAQMVAHPLLNEIRQHRTTFATLMKQLLLPNTNEGALQKQERVSQQNTKAARARWDRVRTGTAA